ncbi:MAG: membrane protein insertase YidC [Alphaproteobacteria bacterium]|nr:membrane protein insertase YidC [Alphaproteobacteria bacterium]
MNDIRRTILWVIFGFSMVLLWDQWQIHNGNKPTFFPQSPSKTEAVGDASVQSGSAAGLPAASQGAGSTPSANGVPVPQGASNITREKFDIKTDVLHLVIDSEGANIVRADLLAFKDHSLQDQSMRLLSDSKNMIYQAQSGVVTSDPNGQSPTHKTLMRLVSKQTELKEGQDTLEVVFESDVQGGLQLIKRYVLKRGEYLIKTDFDIINRSNAHITPQLYVQLVRDGSKPAGESSFYSTFTGPAIYTSAKKYQKVEFSDIDKNKAEFEKQSNDGYVGMVQHYFTSAWLLPDNIRRDIYARKVDNNLYSVGMIAPLSAIEPGAKASNQASLFVGPQQEKSLEAIYPGLELVKDYGWLTILSKPLYWLLYELNKLLNNWGWSIVALVVLIKIAFYWLNAQAYRSMAKMKAINPRVMNLRERMKDNPQQMQVEMMKLYREEKVNPMGGCLPIAIQIPVFIALYWVLLSTVEMRDAPWIGWVHDLASPDPYFILPVLMTLSTLLQTWLNPTPPDAMQAKLMWIMPLAFSVMFFFFPAGLVLYWLTNNILSIAQQWMINKQLGVLK